MSRGAAPALSMQALASISFVAHLTITTQTEGAQHGHRVSYHDGES